MIFQNIMSSDIDLYFSFSNLQYSIYMIDTYKNLKFRFTHTSFFMFSMAQLFQEDDYNKIFVIYILVPTI